MTYARYVALVLVSLFASLLNFVLAPIVVLFASEDGWLPRWLSWFQTPDNSLDGDSGWRRLHMPFKDEDSKVKRWVNRTAWLYRNSMYGLDIDVLGAKLLPTDLILVQGNPKVSNRPIFPGLVVRTVKRNGKLVYFQWYYVKDWSETRCIRINIGWKLWGKTPSGQLVFSPNPFMGLSRPAK